MKRLVLLFLVIPVLVFSQTVTILCPGDSKIGETTHLGEALRLAKKDFPKAEIKLLGVDTVDGSTISMDALLASGKAPNIYYDAVMRTSKYMVPEYALPLDEYIRDLDKYKKNILDEYRNNGKIYGLPEGGGGYSMCLNMDVVNSVGYKVPDNWTIDDFLKLCALVKAKYGDTKIITNMHAGSQSGDYIINLWYGSFGVKWYNDHNYDVARVADNGGAKVYAFFQDLMRKGYIPSNSATMTDDDRDLEWSKGNVVSTGYNPGWVVNQDAAIKQGILAKRFEVKFVPFPRAPGVTKTPLYYYGGVYVVHKTGTDADKVAARVVEYANGAWWQESQNFAIFPNRNDTKPPTDPVMRLIGKMIDANGIQDMGITDYRFTARRAVQYPILQKVLRFEVTPEVGIKMFQDALNAVK